MLPMQEHGFDSSGQGTEQKKKLSSKNKNFFIAKVIIVTIKITDKH